VAIYTDSLYQTQYFTYSKQTQLAYRIGPNYTCEIVDIVVYPQGQGLGTILYNNFEKIIKNEGIKNMYAFTRFTNTKAVKWYKSVGFSATEIPNYYFDEPEYKAWILTKNLF